ncbi:pyridoxamine 5'-phosphate oxidase family protein [Leifsonia sp. 2MCAF36]|uniref:pyridoxamine 5'-phosphate oxidase family protein n=1 Tax=Leifsonia sp. 2MCAF36 TaxID=3232988 RepID=UPI003F98D82E
MPAEMTHDERETLLASQRVGRLGLIDGRLPYVVPISYAYRDGAVYCHSAQGQKVRALRSQSEVCFEVDELLSLEKWRSVIAYGRFEQLVGADAQEGVRILLDRFRPLVSVTATDVPPEAGLGVSRALDVPRLQSGKAEMGHPTGAVVVFRVKLHTVSGRSEGDW